MRAIVIMLALLLPGISSAQHLSFGLEAGAAYGSSKIKSSGRGLEAYISPRDVNFRGGMPVNLSLSRHVKLYSGIFYATKGSRQTIEGYLIGGGGVLSYGSVEVPLMLTCKYSNKEQHRFFAGIGPYLGVGVHGKKRSKDQRPLMTYLDTEVPVRWGNDAGYDMRRTQ